MSRRSNGFSLIELTVASALGIFLVMVAVGFSGKLQSQISGLNLEQASLEELQTADLALSNASNCNKFFTGKSFTSGSIDVTATMKASAKPLFSSRATIDQARLNAVANHPSMALLHVEFHMADQKQHVQDLPVYYDLDPAFRISTCSSSPIDSVSTITCP